MKQLPREIIDDIYEELNNYIFTSQSTEELIGREIRKVIEKHLGLYLSLLQEQEDVCTACYGKGKYSVYKGDAVAGVDFPGDKPFVVEQGGVKEFPCPKCKGKVDEQEALAELADDWIDEAIKYFELTNDNGHTTGRGPMTPKGKQDFKNAILKYMPKQEQEAKPQIEKIEKGKRTYPTDPLVYFKVNELVDTVNSLLTK